MFDDILLSVANSLVEFDLQLIETRRVVDEGFPLTELLVGLKLDAVNDRLIDALGDAPGGGLIMLRNEIE